MRHEFGVVPATLALLCCLLLPVGPAPGAPAVGSALQEALKASGWDVTSLADGTLELRVRSPEPVAAREPPPKDIVGPIPHADVQASPPWELLRESGWRVETGADGSTLLFPPVAEVGKLPPQGSGIEVKVEEVVRGEPVSPPLKGLDAYLEERGWRVERSRDGSLLLYPHGPASPATPRAPPKPCPGVVPKPVTDGRIELPVDRWEEAKSIAESWLASVDSPGGSVGRIRRVLGVYLVSIVDAAPPHRLLHQVGISADDGRVVVLR